MSKAPRIKGPISKFMPPELNEDQYFELFDILHESCLQGNYAATARILGVSAITAKKWAKQPPQNPWINHTLHTAIMSVYQAMLNSKHKKIRKRASNVRGALHRSGLHTLQEYLGYFEANNSGVQRALLHHVHKHSVVSLDYLRKPGVMGSYSARAIRTAADACGLIRETRGYGKDKETWIRIPTEEDLN